MKCKLFVVIFICFIYNLAYAQKPEARFSSSTIRGCVPLTVTFTGHSITVPGGTFTSSCDGFSFDFGDGTSTTLGVAIKTFNRPGNYTVSLTASCNGTGFPSPSETPVEQVIQVLDTIKPSFTVSACAGRVGKVTLNESKYDLYKVNWGDGSTAETIAGNNTKSHVYAASSLQNITVTGSYINSIAGIGMDTCSRNSFASITPYLTLIKPVIKQLAVNNLSINAGSINLSFVGVSNMKYLLQQKTGINPYATIDTLFNNSGLTLSTIAGLNTFQNLYCFNLIAFDDCPTTPDPNTEICSLSISGFADTTGNTVTWGRFPESANYTLSVNGTSLTSLLGSTFGFAGSTLSYKDTDVICNQFYCYQAEASYFINADTLKSTSAPLCLIGQKKTVYTGVANLNSTYESNKVRLFWDTVSFPGISYRIFSSGNLSGSPGTFSDSTKNNSLVPSNQTASCYSVQVYSGCGPSDFKTTCPVKISGQKDNLVQNSLQWTNYINGNNLTYTYEIELATETQQSISSEFLGTATTFVHTPIDTSNQTVNYRIKITLSDGTVVYSNFIPIRQDVRLFVPTAFTPNADGLNDVFLPKGLFWNEFELIVYNRWGQAVFKSTDKSKGWEASNFNPDIYHYYAKAIDQYGTEIIRKGTLQLIR